MINLPLPFYFPKTNSIKLLQLVSILSRGLANYNPLNQ